MSTPSSTAAPRGFLLVLLAAVCWGTADFTGGLLERHSALRPLDVAWYRMAVAAVILLVVHLLSRRRRAPAPRPTRPVVVRLVLIATGLGGYQLAFFAAVAKAGVSISTLVALGLAPLFVALATIALGHGRPNPTTVVCLVLALVGLVLLVGVSAGDSTGTTVLLGALLAVGSGLGYALVIVCGAGVPAGVPVNLIAFGGGALLLTPVILVAGLRLPTDARTVALLLYLGVVPSALAYRLFFSGLRSVPGPIASIVTLMEPVTATLLATGFLRERLAPAALVGGALVLLAVATLYLRQAAGSTPGARRFGRRMGDSNSPEGTSIQDHREARKPPEQGKGWPGVLAGASKYAPMLRRRYHAKHHGCSDPPPSHPVNEP